MRRAVLFLVLTFACYAVGQRAGGAGSVGSTGGASASGTASGGSASGLNTGMPAANPSNGPGAGAPATNDNAPTAIPGSANNPAATPVTLSGATNTTTSTSTTNGTTNSTNGVFNNTGGFITSGSYGGGGYVPLLQTPEASFASPLSTNIPNNPAGISNSPSALSPANNTPSENQRFFDTGAASYGTDRAQADLRPLGDIARDTRAQHRGQAARVFTNADIQRMNQNNGQVAMGTNIGPQSNTAPATQQPQSPTTPAMNNPAPQQNNSNLPANEPK